MKNITATPPEAVDPREICLAPMTEVVYCAQNYLRTLLDRATQHTGLTQDMHVRTLSFQYHLTRPVQMALLEVAAHPSLAARPALREFLVHFAIEEESRSRIAENKLRQLEHVPAACPLDVMLWGAYFNKVDSLRPFVRLGAACVLEDLIPLQFQEARPQGELVYQALLSVPVSADEIVDLRSGAMAGSQMYLRMAAWALHVDPLQEEFALIGEAS